MLIFNVINLEFWLKRWW